MVLPTGTGREKGVEGWGHLITDDPSLLVTAKMVIIVDSLAGQASGASGQAGECTFPKMPWPFPSGSAAGLPSTLFQPERLSL